MPNDIIQAQYEQLETIATRFGNQAETNAELYNHVQQGVQALQQGGWEGEGVEAFLTEMEGDVFPAMQRLTAALEEAQTVTLDIKNIIRQAEEEAASIFSGNGESIPFGPQSTPLSPPGPEITPTPFPPGFTPDPSTVCPVPGPPQDEGTIWDHFNLKGKIWEFGTDRDDGFASKGKFNPGIDATFGIDLGKAPKDSLEVFGGRAEAGLRAGWSKEDGPQVMIGVGGEFYTAKGEWDTALVGDKDLGVTGGVGIKGPSAEGFAGVRFDSEGKRIGAEVGINLASVEGSVGLNVAGANVSVTGEIGLKAELGFGLSDKGVKVKLPFVSFGFKFGGGVD